MTRSKEGATAASLVCGGLVGNAVALSSVTSTNPSSRSSRLPDGCPCVSGEKKRLGDGGLLKSSARRTLRSPCRSLSARLGWGGKAGRELGGLRIWHTVWRREAQTWRR